MTPRVPVGLWALALAAVAFLVLPVVALLAQVPYGELWERLTEPELLAALRLSLGTSLTSTALCLLLGVPLAWLLARNALPAPRLVRGLVVLPLVLPPVAGGLALLLLLGRNGLLGGALSAFGVTVPFTTLAVVLAQTFVALPFLVLAAEGAFRAVDQRLGDVARTLGAGSWTVLGRVDVPLARSGIAAGALLAWARAVGEFGATVTFAGALPGVTETLPVALYRALERDLAAATVVGLVLLGLSLAVVLLLRGRWVGSL